MDIPMNADVLCGDEECGKSRYLIINPVNERVTHLVVVEKEFPNIERLVPVDLIRESTPASIHLRCSRADLSDMESFEQTDFISSDEMEFTLTYSSPYMMWPYGMYHEMPMPLEHKHIPAGEVAIHRGTSVMATDGRVGKVDEFLVNPENDSITHLVLREGHLWGKKDVTIPVSEVDKITDDGVYLKLDKNALADLPAIAVRRKWL